MLWAVRFRTTMALLRSDAALDIKRDHRSPAKLFVQHFVHTNNKEIIHALHHWPFVKGIHLSPVFPIAKGQ